MKINNPVYPSAEQLGAVPVSRKINGHPLSGDVTLTKADVGLGNVDNTADSAKSVASAAKLTAARTIALSGAVTGTATSFNGTENITIPTTGLDISKANAGILPVARGGTGATTAEAALSALGGLPKSGGEMTGQVIMNGASATIGAKFPTRTNAVIRFYEGDSNGHGMTMETGGRIIIGGGEAATNLRNALGTTNADESKEELHLAADVNIQLHTACQAIENRKTVTITNAGKVEAPAGFTGPIDYITYGTADLTAGTSALTTGKVYLVYE